MIERVLFVSLALFVAISVGQFVCPAPPLPCDPISCFEPNCACATSEPSVDRSLRPQIIYLSFDDAFSALTEKDYYNGLFNGTFRNPNGCAIRATHFVTHQSNDYALNNRYHALGHEFATHSITHRSNTTYWQTLQKDGWIAEMVDLKSMIAKYANIPITDIVGMRAPYLQGGGDEQFSIMADNNFLYDCSQPNREYGHTNLGNGIWPYSLDYDTRFLDCQIEPCPNCVWPNVWSQPLLDLEDMWLGAGGEPGVGVPCVMLEGCIIPNENNGIQVKEMMMKNFLRAYNGNTRAPLGFFMHASYFYTAPWHYEGYKLFLEEITTQAPYNTDTWIVPVKDGIAYRKRPVPNAQLMDPNGLFGCNSFVNTTCASKSCAYYNVSTPDFFLNEVRMQSCITCPPVYPWLGNPDGVRPPTTQ